MSLLAEIIESEQEALAGALPDSYLVTSEPTAGYAALAAGKNTAIITEPNLKPESYCQLVADFEVWLIAAEQDQTQARAALSSGIEALVPLGFDSAYALGVTPPGTTRYFAAYKITYSNSYQI
ncbi:MAG: hypothetical protein KIA12_05520 [Varibaculum cambriense]|uniref:hypothetical protein n=1 Tax=Varibaculum cambriense TaxID=184870 RepID=UPI00241F18F8|nr:hypothetical protein [Varibaculum cambriense]MBS5972936.1 hypothetical protein [Varibaculum cambriense]